MVLPIASLSPLAWGTGLGATMGGSTRVTLGMSLMDTDPLTGLGPCAEAQRTQQVGGPCTKCSGVRALLRVSRIN